MVGVESVDDKSRPVAVGTSTRFACSVTSVIVKSCLDMSVSYTSHSEQRVASLHGVFISLTKQISQALVFVADERMCPLCPWCAARLRRMYYRPFYLFTFLGKRWQYSTALELRYDNRCGGELMYGSFISLL